MSKIKFIFLSMFLFLGLTVETENANAFTLFGVNFGEIWEKVKFWEDKEEEKVEKKESNSNQKKTSNANKVSKPKSKPTFVYNITLGGSVYTEAYLKQIFKYDTSLQEYVKGFNYECMAIQTDKETKFTLYFNTDKGTLNKMRPKIDCDKEIYLEESLIDDIRSEGFKASNIKSYLKKTELPTSMYFKAIKVFTVG